MLSRKTEEILRRANHLSEEKNHEYCTAEHVFWALLEDPTVVEALSACGAKISELRSQIERHIETEMSGVAPRDESIAGAEGPHRPDFTLAVQNLIQRAVFQVQSSGGHEVEPKDLLVSFFTAKGSYA